MSCTTNKYSIFKYPSTEASYNSSAKVPFIHDVLVHNKLLFIALTETWLRDHLDAEVNVDVYKLFRQDRVRVRFNRKGRDGGGTACYLKNYLLWLLWCIHCLSLADVICLRQWGYPLGSPPGA